MCVCGCVSTCMWVYRTVHRYLSFSSSFAGMGSLVVFCCLCQDSWPVSYVQFSCLLWGELGLHRLARLCMSFYTCALDPKPGPLVCMHIVFHWATSALLVHFRVLWGWTDVMETDPFYTAHSLVFTNLRQNKEGHLFQRKSFLGKTARCTVPRAFFPREGCW